MTWIPVTRPPLPPTPVRSEPFAAAVGERLTPTWSVPSHGAVELLAAQDRVVAVRPHAPDGSQRVDVHAGDGTVLHTISGSRSAWTIDPRGPTLLGTTADGRPAAWSLQGRAAPEPIVWSMRFGGRRLLQLQLEGDVVVASGLEPKRLADPHPSVLVAVLRIPGWDDVSPHGTLRGVERIAECIGEATGHALVGVHDGGLVLATRGHVQWVDWGLAVVGRLDAVGDPIGCDRGWLLAATAAGPRLRRLGVGRCEFELEVRQTFGRGTQLRPMPDGGVVLTAPGRIEAFGPRGQTRWKFARSGTPHAVVDRRGTTLFSHGPTVVAAALDGTNWAVWSAPEGIESLGPLCLADGRVYVVGGGRLFALDTA